jgi:hypothetical protein
MKWLEIRAQRRLEESRHRRAIEIQDRKAKRRQEIEQAKINYKNKFHPVGVIECPGSINLVLSSQDNKKAGECTPIWVLEENGFGDRRYRKEWQGTQDPNKGWSHVWESTNTHKTVLAWVYRDPECEIKTNLPPNANAEDRAWQQLGA